MASDRYGGPQKLVLLWYELIDVGANVLSVVSKELYFIVAKVWFDFNVK